MVTRLDSPGVDVRVIDESMYASAGPGTIPLFIIATEENKTHPSGVGIAEGTKPENAGVLYLITSQRELIQTFGNPLFQEDEIGTPLHGDERNEFGLHAAFQYLGIANRCYVVRAGVDLSQLKPNRFEPEGDPRPGTYWFDTAHSSYGIFTSNGSAVTGTAWSPRSAIRIDNVSLVDRVALGTAYYGNSSDVVTATAQTLVINGVSISIPANSNLAAIKNLISPTSGAAPIPGIDASVYRINEKSCIMIRNTQGGTLTFNGSTGGILTALGIGGSYSTFVTPKKTVGNEGDFAIVTLGTDNVIFQKLVPQLNNGNADSSSDASAHWFPVGSDEWRRATPTVVIGTTFNASGLTATDQVKINGYGPIAVGNSVSDFVSNITAYFANSANAGAGTIVADVAATTKIRIACVTGEDITLANEGSGTGLAHFGLDAGVTRGNRLFYASHTQLPSGSAAGDVWINTTQPNNGSKWVVKLFSQVTGRWMSIAAPLYASDADATAGYGSTMAAGNLYVNYGIYSSGSNKIASARIKVATRNSSGAIVWQPLLYTASRTEPKDPPKKGRLWYNDDIKVDIMVNENGSQWVGYGRHAMTNATDPAGPFLQASPPLTQRDGVTPLAQGELWINTADMENFPVIYRWDLMAQSWLKVDNTDQSTPNGIVFDDARADAGPWLAASEGYNAFGTDPEDMWLSNYVDPDCVDPRHYPDGTLLFNLRYSTLTVKRWEPEYFMGTYGESDDGAADGADYTSLSTYNVGNRVINHTITNPGRWVTSSGLRYDGAPNMGRHAQRIMVVQSLADAIVDNEVLRAETVYFNLIACPGYIELLDEMINLNVDKKEVAFIVTDPPARLKPDAQSIQTWCNPLAISTAGSMPNSEEGLGTSYPYAGIYYPWGLSTNFDGKEIMIPPSTIAMRTMAYNDSVAYPWFAPAGFTRGLVTNATTVGYLTKEGEFKPVMLNQRQRDVLYLNKINPIAYIPQRGLVIYGQKTLHNQETALDRVNVARLTNYLRFQFDVLAKPFLFEPNDKQTRDSAQITFERFLGDLVGLRAVYDFLVVCDESNNTPVRIDRNELWIDVAIQPVKTVEFIIIPIRIKNTGEDMALNNGTTTLQNGTI